MAKKQGRGAANVNWGICTNTSGKADGTPCSKCQNKEKQAIRSTMDFVCEECKEPLTKIPAPPPPTNIPLIVGAVVVVIGLAVGGYFFINGNKAKKAQVERAAFVADSLRKVAEAQRIADSLRVADSIRIADSIAAAQKKPASSPSGQSSGTSNWNGVASYNGPMKGGQPNGIGGKLTFKSNYSLDLKDGKGTKLDIKAGETIENTKFENGKLRQGELHRKDGTRKWFNI